MIMATFTFNIVLGDIAAHHEPLLPIHCPHDPVPAGHQPPAQLVPLLQAEPVGAHGGAEADIGPIVQPPVLADCPHLAVTAADALHHSVNLDRGQINIILVSIIHQHLGPSGALSLSWEIKCSISEHDLKIHEILDKDPKLLFYILSISTVYDSF